MPPDETDGTLIAETGEDGTVARFWVLLPGHRIPRPFHRHRHAGMRFDRCNIFAATADAVANWLDTALPA